MARVGQIGIVVAGEEDEFDAVLFAEIEELHDLPGGGGPVFRVVDLGGVTVDDQCARTVP